jgi:hypothetical protein
MQPPRLENEGGNRELDGIEPKYRREVAGSVPHV